MNVRLRDLFREVIVIAATVGRVMGSIVFWPCRGLPFFATALP